MATSSGATTADVVAGGVLVRETEASDDHCIAVVLAATETAAATGDDVSPGEFCGIQRYFVLPDVDDELARRRGGQFLARSS